MHSVTTAFMTGQIWEHGDNKLKVVPVKIARCIGIDRYLTCKGEKMNKSDLFPVLDKQAKHLGQIQSLTSVLVIAGGLTELPKHTLCDCISLIGDLVADAQQSHTLIADSVTGHSMDEGA